MLVILSLDSLHSVTCGNIAARTRLSYLKWWTFAGHERTSALVAFGQSETTYVIGTDIVSLKEQWLQRKGKKAAKKEKKAKGNNIIWVSSVYFL